jgi:ATP-dependent HslUV protease subunit HslV
VRYTDQTAKEIVENAMRIAAETCIYTNNEITIEELAE